MSTLPSSLIALPRPLMALGVAAALLIAAAVVLCVHYGTDVFEVMRRLGPDADRAAALFITVDPQRDTPATLKDYLSSFDPHLRGITGSPDAIAAVAKAYRVYYKKVPTEGDDYTMDHTAIV